MLELGNLSEQLHYEVGCQFKELEYDELYLLGKEVKNIAKGAKGYTDIKYCNSIEELISILVKELKSGDVVYLKASNGMHFNIIIDRLKKNFKSM